MDASATYPGIDTNRSAPAFNATAVKRIRFRFIHDGPNAGPHNRGEPLMKMATAPPKPGGNLMQNNIDSQLGS